MRLVYSYDGDCNLLTVDQQANGALTSRRRFTYECWE